MMNIKEVKKRYGVNKPIFIKDLMKDSNLSYGSLRNWLSKETNAGNIKRYCDGVYYFSSMTKYGKSTLSSTEIIKRRYLQDAEEIFGYYGGLDLLEQARISTQIPAESTIVTNREATRGRKLKIGPARIRLKKARIKITKENVNEMRFLELLNELGKGEVQKYKKEIRWFYQKYPINKIVLFECAESFPKKVLLNLVKCEVLNILSE